MAVHAANMYITANLLLLLAAVGVACLRWVSGRLANPIAYRRQLQIAYALSVAIVLPPSALVIPQRTDVMPRNAQIWSAASMQDWSPSAENSHRIAISVASSELSVSLWAAGTMTVALLLAGFAVFAITLLIEAARIRRIVVDAQIIARRRHVRVLSSQAVCVPFSFWLPGLHFIVVPADLILRPADLRMAIRHEAQHHRQLDTRVTYIYQLLRALFFWNPAVHWLNKCVSELQEFACDEVLIAQRKVSPHAYCSCLMRVAEAAVKQQRMSICTGMLGGAGRGILKNRIEALLTGRSKAGQAPAMALGGAMLALMSGMTVAFSATIQDRRITPEIAQQMLAVASQRSDFFPVAPERVLLAAVHPDADFPLAVNERVIEQLNLLLGTPDGRAFLRTSLQRMQDHESLIVGALAQYALPAELMAVPLVESGYRNLPHDDHPGHGAGLWMFIERTAREFGLVVNANIDERLNVVLETDAAMRMFDRLYERFGDWGLALLAYNAGERLVEQGIRATGSRDVWQIVERGYENDPDYVARVTAVLLIMKNPTALN